MVKVMTYEKALNNIYEIVKKHSNLFSHNAYDISILPGWITLVDELLCELQGRLGNNERIQIVQVKEKFGRLRLHFGTIGIPDERLFLFKGPIEEAEAKSAKTCIFCGDKGSMTNNGWISPRCPSHVDAEMDLDRSVVVLAKHEDKMAKLLKQS